MAHTQGPWMVDARYLSEVQTADDKTVASCWHEHADGQEITVRGVLCCTMEESAANARLIAAAPELLADVIEAERMFRWYGDMHAAKPDPDKAARNYAMADCLAATIAKATGATE